MSLKSECSRPGPGHEASHGPRISPANKIITVNLNSNVNVRNPDFRISDSDLELNYISNRKF